MNDTAMRLEQLKQRFTEKQQKKYKIDVFIRLCKKLEGLDPEGILAMMDETLELLTQLSEEDHELKPSQYIKSFTKLQKEVRRQLGFTEEGQIRGEYVGIGIALGVALGTPFVAINPAFIGIGLPIGLALGAGIGDQKEKAAAAEGKVY